MPPFVIPADHLDQMMTDHNTTITAVTVHVLHPMEAVAAFVYSLLFLSGFISNIWVLRVFYVVVRTSRNAYSTVSFYTMILTCVSLVVLLSVPVTIADLVTGHWTLPDALCPFYWLAEMLNKIGCSLLVAFIAASCYFGVCRPHMKSMYKSPLVAAVHLAVALVHLTWKSYHLWLYSGVFYIVDMVDGTTLDIIGRKCLFEPSRAQDRALFTVSAFLSGYAVPVLVIVACYSAILRRVYGRSRLLSRRGLRQFQNVARSASILVIFYVLTWSPYWFVTVILGTTPEYGHHEILGKVAFFLHILPIANCAFSPLIYTLLNRHLREQYRSAINGRLHLMREVRSTTTCL